jgi:hypothetical protein
MDDEHFVALTSRTRSDEQQRVLLTRLQPIACAFDFFVAATSGHSREPTQISSSSEPTRLGLGLDGVFELA